MLKKAHFFYGVYPKTVFIKFSDIQVMLKETIKWQIILICLFYFKSKKNL